jgi:hypothetical protein
LFNYAYSGLAPNGTPPAFFREPTVSINGTNGLTVNWIGRSINSNPVTYHVE